jgi:hypothetical protein
LKVARETQLIANKETSIRRSLQDDHEFETSQGYIGRPCLKKKKERKKEKAKQTKPKVNRRLEQENEIESRKTIEKINKTKFF